MRTCSICQHWNPVDTTPWGTVADEEAQCFLDPTIVDAPVTACDFTCEYAVINPEQKSGSQNRYLGNKRLSVKSGKVINIPSHLLYLLEVEKATCVICGAPADYDHEICSICKNIAHDNGFAIAEIKENPGLIKDFDRSGYEPWHPLEVKPSTSSEIKIDQDIEQEDFEEFLSEDDGLEFDDIPTNKTRQLKQEYVAYKHQDEAFERYKDSTEIALFLEQGLGKTKIILDIARYKFKKGDINALLVIAPNGVHKQWAREQIPIWMQGVEYDLQIIGGRGGKNKGRRFKSNLLQICCTNIDTFSTPIKWQDITEWANANNTFIVLDEATVIKNLTSKRTERLLYEFNDVQRRGKRIISSRVKSACRAILTGTPVTNGPFDVWTLFEFLRPNYFNRNYYSFRSHFGMFWQMVVENGGRARAIEILINPEIWRRVKQIYTWNEAHAIFGISENTYNYIHSQIAYDGPFKYVDELKQLMAPVAMFRTLDECVDMPKRIYTRRLLEMDSEQARVYKDMEDQLIAEYEGKTTDAKSKLTVYIRLQQIAAGFISSVPDFALIGDEDIEVWEPDKKEITWIGNTNPKLQALIADVEACHVPCIIICHFSAEAERLFNELAKIKRCCLQTGWKKVGTIEEFQSGQYDCLVANIRCISRGFNLQVASRMFFYSNTFSLEDRLQVERRIHRIGQTEKCEYTDYIMLNTIDMKTVAALRQKKNLLDYVRGTTVKQMLTEVDDVFNIEYDGVDFSKD